jgi:hypothetical protein
MSSSIHVGLSLTSHDNTKLNTSIFDSISVTSGTTLKLANRASSAAQPATPAKHVIDGKTATYFESTLPDGAWVSLDLGSAKTITQIKFAPRSGYGARLVGGKFQASNNANFSGEVVDLYTIKSEPRNHTLTSAAVKPHKPYRYVRYVAPAGSYGSIAETAVIGF